MPVVVGIGMLVWLALGLSVDPETIRASVHAGESKK